MHAQGRNWICSSSPPAARHIFAPLRRKSVGAIPGTPAASVGLEELPDDLFRHLIAEHTIPPADWSEHMAFGRRRRPGVDGDLRHIGIGIVRTRPCSPTRSTMHHRLSRCWMWFTGPGGR
jgi:hypothetical protein